MFQTTRRTLVVSGTLLLAMLSLGSVSARSAPFSGDEVREVQQTLYNIGFWPGPVDGIQGSRTRAAIREFQRRENLPVTGRMDNETVRRIEEARRAYDADRGKFQGMDANNDAVISRQEYAGNDRSFANHDWNGDGVLSGEEVRPGAHRPARHNRRPTESSSVGGEFKGAGKAMGHGSKKAAHEMKEGKPVASGKEFGKGAGRFGKKVGKGVKEAVTP